MPVPMQVAGSLAFQAVTAGHRETCGIETDGGGGWCWGDYGVLGFEALAEKTVPVPMAGGHRFFAIGTGEAFGCGLAAAA